MGGKHQFLPPAKRFMLMQQQEHNNNVVDFPKPANKPTISSSQLPAKKRKLSPENSPLFSNTSICLPAKKRVWAFHPFDLNVEYNPLISNQEGEKEVVTTNVDDYDDDDDGIVCAICDSTDGDPLDPIVLCDGCDLMVHTSCYGHPFTNGIPEGDWFCAQCLVSKSLVSKSPNPFTCCLCPEKTGALKPTTNDGKWAHVVCALFVPEVFFVDSEGREGIDFSKVPKRRWDRKCYICKTRKGCAIDCSEPKCPLSFHVTCGLKRDLCIEYTEGKNKGAVVAGFCTSHTELWKKQQRTGKFKIVPREELDR